MPSINFSQTASCLIVFFMICGILSCKQIELYEKNTAFANHQWKSNEPAAGSFEISDTSAHYNIYIVLRHTDAYKYNNIWLNVGLQSPGDSLYFQKVNFNLGDDANGWKGTGMNDIWEIRLPLNDKPRRFIKKGIYRFSLVNIMRDDPLNAVMSAGMRVEKADNRLR